jgi:UDP-N-acetylmuramoylalanine--D-glutamate ligase
MPRIAILGAGESGVGSAVLALKKGYEVFLSDKGVIQDKYKDVLLNHKIEWEEGKHTEERILSASEIIKSPGIPDKAEIIKKAKEKGIKVISEIEFAGRYTKAKTICITGSNGKTTTTLLTYHILKKAGVNVGLAGNIGQSFALQVAEKDHEWYVLELSSFQLDGMFDFKADISVLLNITPDHLDRYEYQMQNYTDSKFRVIQNQSTDNSFIYCADDEVISNELKKKTIEVTSFPFSIMKKEGMAAWLENEELNINSANYKFTMSIHDLALQGKHNIYNSMAAGLVAKILEIRKDVVRESLQDFRNAEHRLEPVLSVHGIQFINDSKATNVNSTWYALESMESPVVLILGGVDKGNDYSMLAELVKDKVKAIVCLGKDNERIHKAFENVVDRIVDVSSAKEAVEASYSIATKGDVVLLSPACASFDLFQNYEDRGRQFKTAVRAL